MFKRANKITALLVAAASVMSLVPAMAATRIGTRDGHITGEAIAYDGGKYAYEGYRTKDDDNGIYYNDGTDSKEKFNEDLRDYTLTSKYGTKYAYATDNNDQYLVDLTTGKIVDTETPEDKADQIKSDLKSKLKRTDRYSRTGSWDTISLGDSYETERYNDNTRLFGDKFGEVWYEYVANGDKDYVAPQSGQTAAKASFTVKLPTTLDTYTIPGTTKSYGTVGTSLSALRDDMLTKITADIKANYADIFDYTTVQIVGNTIVGYAKTTGEISKDNTELIAFANAYGVSASLAGIGMATSGTTDTVAATGTNGLSLGTLSTVSTSDSNVATASNDANTVTILKGNVGKATITVKDTVAKVATISVEVTSRDGVRYITSTPNHYVDSTTVTNSVAAIILGNGTAVFTDYQNAGLTDLVSAGTSRTKLTFTEANTVVKNYIATGDIKLGATIADATVLRDVLQKGLDLKLKNQMDTDSVLLNRGLNQQGGSLGDPSRYVGFVSESGKYVDVSNLANISVYSKDAQKTVKVKEYNKVNADYNITVGLQNIKALAQDKDYIYTLTTVGVVEGTGAVETQYFIQKISKAQGSDKDGAYIPKSVESYQVDNKTIFDDSDASKIYELLVTGTDSDSFVTDNVSVKDGALYITGVKNDGDHDKVKVFKATLKKDKIDTVSSYGKGSIKDADVYIAKKDADTDIEIAENTRDTAVAYDIDGNTWTINKGTITKITGTDKKDMFTCDHSFHNLDVYNDSNVIAWDKDADFYTNVAEGTKVTAGEATAVAPTIVTGWVKGTDGTWTFNDMAGAKVTNKWMNIGGNWYFLKADGIMATGWYNDRGTWYFLNTSGAMATGWLNDGGTWYYLAGSGAMLANTTVDGYVLNASGAWVK